MVWSVVSVRYINEINAITTLNRNLFAIRRPLKCIPTIVWTLWAKCGNLLQVRGAFCRDQRIFYLWCRCTNCLCCGGLSVTCVTTTSQETDQHSERNRAG